MRGIHRGDARQPNCDGQQVRWTGWDY
uniref:Uncharacterized protein n=1 Tax=Anguilla anguilla TaxID=7936 RepID=A0A0E9PI56_ANGAN